MDHDRSLKYLVTFSSRRILARALAVARILRSASASTGNCCGEERHPDVTLRTLSIFITVLSPHADISWVRHCEPYAHAGGISAGSGAGDAGR